MSDNKKKRGWLARTFFGGSKELADDFDKKAEEGLDVEEIVSPVKQVVRSFMERKLAVVSLCVLIAMLLFVFVGPLFMPNYTDTYTETTQINLPPTMNMRSVPSELKNDIKMIDSFGSFTIGLSNAGKVYVWGATGVGTTGIDMKDVPQEVLDHKIAYIAAGIDHAIAISEEGKVYAWGASKNGQYGHNLEQNDKILDMPDELINGTIDVANIKKVTCGYQASAILMNDGSVYIWGNKNAYQNLENFTGADNLVDIDFTLNYVVGVTKTGNSIFTGKRGLYDNLRPNLNVKALPSKQYLNGRKIVGVCASSKNLCALLDDGSVCFAGDFDSSSLPMPALQEGETVVKVVSGTHHYSLLTNNGRVLSWGNNTFGQASAPDEANDASDLFAGAFQNYSVSESHSLLSSWGLKGYVFGTDKNGADILQRIIQGGKMTMTIGAVAVVISTIVGVIIGVLAGYFGGKADMLLMRITEIFAAIPFLPFAMIMSALLAQSSISEDMKIFVLMVILGLLSWTGLARLVRGQILVAREQEYVTAAKAMGLRESRIAFRHILPNVISVILVTITLDFATCMLTESSLSYLGFGVNYPRPTWGNMLNGANNLTVISNFWWQWVFTSLFLAITCICINIVGDTLRDAMDPKSDRDK